MLSRLGSLILILAVASPAFPDDLAALAKKEKERRAKLAKPGRVYTEEDGKATGTGSVTTMPGPPATPPEAPPAGASKEDQKAMWKARADAARTEIAASQARLADLKREYAEFDSDIAEVPAAELLDPMRLQKREARKVEMRAQIEQQKQVVADAQKSLSVLETEARKNGIPAGWLR